MKRFWNHHPRRLRWRLLQPLAVTFALLWIGTMILFTNNTCQELRTSTHTAAQSARNSMDEYQEYYTQNLASGLGTEASHILRNNLSGLSLGQVSEMDGGMALIMRTETGYVRSQLAWGWGNQEGVDLGQRWYFSFDEGLDDKGQINLANWLIQNRNSWDYSLYPKDDSEYSTISDGSFARVTGIERPGHEIAVQKIEIIHPNGSIDTMIETSVKGRGQTWNFAYINIRSVLLPSRISNGKDGPVNMGRRLASFREAHEILERELAGEQFSVLTEDGFCLGSRDPSGILSYTAVQCDVLPAALKQNIHLYINTALLSVMVLLILSAKLSRQVTEPTETLCREAAQGICHADGPIQELNTLAAAFNDAQQKLERQLEREREFTRSAAHELKTPLAILRAHAECVREDIAPDKRAAYLDIVLEESDRMAELTGNLLNLAQLESGLPLHMEQIALQPLIREVLKPMALTIEQKQITVSMSLENLWIQGDKDILYKMAENLFSNAIRHTPEGGTIQISLHKQDTQLILTVDNDGSPIPEEALARIWEPFYRVDQARNRTEGGTGLGLTIVRAAVWAHGGFCSAENRPGGVRFRISIPDPSIE